MKGFSKLFLFIVLVIITGTIYSSGAYEYLNFKTIQNNFSVIKQLLDRRPYFFVFIFSFVYILLTSLSIPGGIILTILAGALFGSFLGTLIVSFTSCIGASVAFLMSRYFFRNFIVKHYQGWFAKMDQKFKDGGKSYLFTLRLIPVSPFVVINLLMGLTTIKLWTFFWVTYLGMLPGTFVYVYAGYRLSGVKEPSEVLSLPMILILCILGFSPYIFKRGVSRWQSYRSRNECFE